MLSVLAGGRQEVWVSLDRSYARDFWLKEVLFLKCILKKKKEKKEEISMPVNASTVTGHQKTLACAFSIIK